MAKNSISPSEKSLILNTLEHFLTDLLPPL